MPAAPVSSRSAPTARPSVSESRSRRSSGAVLWETPRARSSDIGADLLALRHRLVAVGAVLGEARELAQVLLHPLQFARHDRDVDDDQDEEDDVGAGDVLARLIERQG